MLSLFFVNPILFFISFAILVVSITIHEFAHAWMADHLGDPTPRVQGRLTLNPLAHLDPIGTLLLIVGGIGWGKPVQFDPYNLKKPVEESAIIALAGPASNIFFVVLLAILTRFLPTSVWWGALAQIIISYTVFLNLTLAVFNFVPIHPLDGSKILLPLLPRQTAYEYEHLMHRYGLVILILFLVPWGSAGSPISHVVFPIVNFLSRIVLPHALN